MKPEQIARQEREDARCKLLPHLLGDRQGVRPLRAVSNRELEILRDLIPDPNDEQRVVGEWHHSAKWRGERFHLFKVRYLKEGPPQYFDVH